jgi:hypothetical protein
MTNKTVSTLAFAAGFVLALGAMPSAHAQYHAPMASPSPPELVAWPTQHPYAGPPQAQMVPMQRPYAGPPQAQMVTNGPQASRRNFGGWSARRNNIESAQYDRLVQTNMGFRQARMRKECGPIGDPQLRDQCLASFDQYEPVMTGSSAPPPHWQQPRGAGN